MIGNRRWGVSLALLVAYGCAGTSTLGSGKDNQPSGTELGDAATRVAPSADAGAEHVDLERDAAASSAQEATDETAVTQTELEPGATTGEEDDEVVAAENSETSADVDAGADQVDPASLAPDSTNSSEEEPNLDTTSASDAATAPVDTTPAPTAPAESEPEDGGAADPTESEEDAGEAVCEAQELEVVSIDQVTPDKSNWYSEEDCEIQEEIVGAPDEVVDLEVSPLAGTWRDGEGDERVELVLDATGHGTLLYGEPVELPSVDPAEAYLVNADNEANFARLGFTYDLHPIDGRASEMTAMLRMTQPWAEWCSLQVPQPGASCYACEPDYNMGFYYNHSGCGTQGCFIPTNSDWTQYAEVDCGRTNLCVGIDKICECTSTMCRNSRRSGREVRFTLDPVDTSVLRVPSVWDSTTRYLVRDE